MKSLLKLLFISSFLLLCFISNGQENKTKTKVKSTTTETNTHSINKQSDMNQQVSIPGLQNSKWETYVEALSDTMVWKFATDTAFSYSKNGGMYVNSSFTVSHDTLAITDIEGMHACLEQTGKYRFVINNDTLTLFLIEDNCQGRAMVINSLKLFRAKE